ncbi:M48 family metallopeptidase [Amphibiibacter pelophylacis]|uniref:M48 family metallopeptidase n=1 Tax=Amphibiibacter pelophylacis TaxID=1799477 RepID=A0ACC6P2K9_9BURK
MNRLRRTAAFATMPDLTPSLIFSLLFAVLISFNLGLKAWLNLRQVRSVLSHQHDVPADFAGHIEPDKHATAARYTADRLQHDLLGSAVAVLLLVCWTLAGGLQWVQEQIAAQPFLVQHPLLAGLVLLGVFALVGALIDLPFSWASTFRLEARYGFNRSTQRLFWSDQARGLLLALLIGGPLAALVLWAMAAAGPLWWLAAWGIWVAFTLAMMVIFPLWIAPLFNRFEPLKDAELLAGIEALMRRCGFQSRGVFVVDGSRRSARANAYFTGLGRAKRVVFYDTLLDKLSPEETHAVLAHELGHFRLNHIAWRIGIALGLGLPLLALLGWVGQQGWFYTGLGVLPGTLPRDHAALLILLMLALPEFTFALSPFTARLSRRHEFEADAYASAHADRDALRSALLKLYRDNASTLTPDPVYARFYYSHPPASERLAALARLPRLTPGLEAQTAGAA